MADGAEHGLSPEAAAAAADAVRAAVDSAGHGLPFYCVALEDVFADGWIAVADGPLSGAAGRLVGASGGSSVADQGVAVASATACGASGVSGISCPPRGQVDGTPDSSGGAVPCSTGPSSAKACAAAGVSSVSGPPGGEADGMPDSKGGAAALSDHPVAGAAGGSAASGRADRLSGAAPCTRGAHAVPHCSSGTASCVLSPGGGVSARCSQSNGVGEHMSGSAAACCGERGSACGRAERRQRLAALLEVRPLYCAAAHCYMLPASNRQSVVCQPVVCQPVVPCG